MQGRRKVWKSGGLVVLGGDNVPPPGRDRVNWSAKNWGAKAPPAPPPPLCDSPAVIQLLPRIHVVCATGWHGITVIYWIFRSEKIHDQHRGHPKFPIIKANQKITLNSIFSSFWAFPCFVQQLLPKGRNISEANIFVHCLEEIVTKSLR